LYEKNRLLYAFNGVLYDSYPCLRAGKTQQPSAKTGGLKFRTESPDTDQRPVFIERISNAAKYTESITQNNAAGAEETACASEEMNRQVEDIKAFVKRLAGLVNSAENFTEDKKQRPVNLSKKQAVIIGKR
jgi:methyl-accepting chemotaxis protein